VANPHLARFRKLCLSLPEATEKEAWGAPTFRVRNKLFAHYQNNHHGDERIAAWCKSITDVQQDLIQADPERFFKPPYVGPSGWVGVRLDRKADWTIVRNIVTQAYRMTAPKTLLRRLDAEGPEHGSAEGP
jgi:hypothetical protein